MAIVAILTAAAVSAFRSVNSSLNLTTASQMVTNELTTARQTALTLDEAVQVRFYQYPDITGATTTSEYQAMQTFSFKNGVYTPLDKITYLPRNIMISSNTTYSSPLGGDSTSSPATTDPSILANNIGQSYKYDSLTFKSNGAIDPAPSTTTGTWYITLYEKKYAISGTPVNFITINLDGVDGRVRVFQP